MVTVAVLLAGLALLVVGGELLVRSAVRVAERLGVSPLLIGLTLVGFGTSTPELVTSLQAAVIGSPGIAVGNVIGSNIANLLLIVGLSAVIVPLAVHGRALRRDGVTMVVAAIALVGVAHTTGLTRPVGAAFLAALAAYLVHAYRSERVGADAHGAAYDKAAALAGVDAALIPHEARGRGGAGGIVAAIALALVGLAIIVVGGTVFVDGAVDLARAIGVSEAVIGLTIVAVGTSMPELVTSVVAAVRGRTDVAIGNVLGSNIYNVLGIAGATAALSPTAVPDQMAAVDAPLMVAASVLLVALAWGNGRVSRAAGAALLVLYAGYVAALVVTRA